MVVTIDKNETRANLVSNLGRLLANAGISQAELARRAGVPRKTIQQTVSGYSLPSIIVVAAIADALGVSVDCLIADPPADPVKRVRRGPRMVETRTRRRRVAADC